MPPQHTPAGLVTALVIIMLAMLIFSPPQRLNVGVHWAHDSAASGRWCRANTIPIKHCPRARRRRGRHHPGHPHPSEGDPDRIKHPDRNRRLAAIRNACRSCFYCTDRSTDRGDPLPYKIGNDKLDLLGQIIRDADLAQALSPAWLQPVVFGLAQEWEMSPLEVLKGQGSFLAGLSFSTCWAQQLFPQELIQAKTEEVEQLLRLLHIGPSSAAGD